MNGIPLIDYVDIRGPFEATGPGDTPSRRRIFVCRPCECRARKMPCATKDPLDAGAPRLSAARHRRRGRDARQLLSGGPQGGDKRDDAAAFDAGMRNGLRLILASPKFLFRAEPDPSKRGAGIDLPAWRSRAGFASVVLPVEQHSRRRAADCRGAGKAEGSRRRSTNRCGGCWPIRAPRRSSGTSPDNGCFSATCRATCQTTRNFRISIDNLRQAFRRETELLFEAVMREDRSVLDLLTADYTFVNERLARHYGIPNVYGSRFRRVTLADVNRRGLLGHGSILTVTSYPEPDLSGSARQVDSGEHPGHAAAAAAGGCACACPTIAETGRALTVRERTGGAPEEPCLRELPSRDGSARVLARELRRHRPVAHRGKRAARSMPRASWRMGPASTALSACARRW